MKRVVLASLMLGIAACGEEETADCCAIPPDKRPVMDDAGAVDATMFVLPSPLPESDACLAGLKERGLKPNELWLMMHDAAGVCPNVGVDEARIRQIIGFWKEAGCTARSPEAMQHALDSGACGGDAG